MGPTEVESATYWLSWLRLMGTVSAFLVAIGVAGEFLKDFLARPYEEILEKAREDDIAQANARAAEANRKAEVEKLARIQIEKQLAPRLLSDADREAISQELLPFVSHFSGRKIKVTSYSQDAEGIVFALTIEDILIRASIETESMIGRSIPIGLVNIGVRITGPTKDGTFIDTLTKRIHARLETRFHSEWKDEYTDLTILVGVKPVAGLPNIVVPDKPLK